MKLFVCGDIHGNLRAIDAALAVYRKNAPCRFLFLGDAVGYGAHPDAVLDRVLALPESILILGNHEWALLDKDEKTVMNPVAVDSVKWTERKIFPRYRNKLVRRFRIMEKNNDYIAAHGSPIAPKEWHYVFSEYDATEIFYKFDFNLCFIGHTHIPMVYTFSDGVIDLVPGIPFRLQEDQRYIINPGSVGQPRDGDSRASFCIFDEEDRTVTLFRVEYDARAEADDIINAGLPAELALRLISGY
ncbi:MAG: metallophosphoesterase family protein [Candidatus Krumholzibacteriota bacterium]|nr:metallophosphoesterase family protein [Candidatus Krumholzibacteriota bacterium]